MKGIATPIGVAMVSHKESVFNDLYKKADTALYKAKEGGKNQICLDVNQALPRVCDKEVLARNPEEALHFQPKFLHSPFFRHSIVEMIFIPRT